jgi:hypothetical protein
MAKKKRVKPDLDLDDNPFVDGLVAWMCSPEGQESEQARDAVWPMLETADVDAKKRKIIWEDGHKLTIAESVQRIHAAYPDLAVDVIESKVISWLELGFSPENRSEKQLDELERLLDEWLQELQEGR